ncbi:MAG: DNA primase [bacterium]
MAERLSQGFLDRIIAATDTVSVIGRYTALKRRGHRFVGLCPFHKEKTPSFTVDPDRGLYYCFGCHAGGSIFNFLMEKEGLTFYQAVENLARAAGIEVPRLEGGGDRTDGLYEAAEFSAKFFRKALKADMGRSAREYILRRGISYETADKYELGWGPADRNHILKSIDKAGLDIEPFIEIDVVGESSGRRYCKINEALVFPISTSSGKIVAFAFRKIENDPNYTGPKYINSSDNKIYHKSSILYGLPQARSSIRSSGKSILVEGYFDVIALAEKGITNAVACCGTALTSEQANLLARFGPKTVMLYDGDSAGLRATLRSFDILLSAGLDVYVVRLPDDEEPDSYVMTHGGEALTEIIENAPDWFDWLYRHIREKSEGSGISIATEIVDEMAVPLASISDEMKRNLYVRELSKRLGTSEESLRDHLRKAYRKQRRHSDYEDEKPQVEELSDEARLELSLVALIVALKSPVKLEDNPLKLYTGLWTMANDGASPSEMLSEITDERARGYLSEALMNASESGESAIGVLLFKLLQKEADRINDLLSKLEGLGNDDEEGTRLLRERSEVMRKIQDLRKQYIR